MISIDYKHDTQVVKICSKYNVEINIDVWVKDIETNLYSHSFWGIIPPRGYIIQEFQGNLTQPSGVIFEVYYKEEQIAEEIFTWGDVKKLPKFSTPKQQAYIHWQDLMDKPCLSITDQDVVYDLGANYGTFSMWARNAKQVYSFEPTPQAVLSLEDTFKDYKNIRVFSKAIGAKHNSTLPFYVFKHHSANSLIDVGGLETKEIINIDVINLEEFIKENNLLPPTIIKCDIEGYELEFINSLSDEFFDTVNQINLEFHYLNYENLGKLLTRFLTLGYTISLKEEMCKERMMGTINLLKTNIRINE